VQVNTQITHQALAELVGGTLAQGDPDGVVTGLNSLAEAAAGEVTFLGNPRYAPQLKSTMATAVLVTSDFTDLPEGKAVIQVANPTLAFSAVISFFGPEPRGFVAGVHPTAVIAAGAHCDATKVYVGPHAVIEDSATIGEGTAIQAGAFIGHGVKIGRDCVIHANAVIKERCILGDRVIIHSGAVIGSDGFGYETAQGRHIKIEQVGIVQIDDDVEIGSCTTIDRARFGRTLIGEGTKIDNLVQLGHNVATGKHCIIVSQTGISGSTRLGNYVVMGGQVGVAGHLQIADQVTIFAKSGVTKSVREPGAYTGYPAKPLIEGRKMMTYPSRVPELLERIKQLEHKLGELEQRIV
jgi:UDP-3-O-[3-hydroxymyristoyl] glucosamine N-acyltransferase